VDANFGDTGVPYPGLPGAHRAANHRRRDRVGSTASTATERFDRGRAVHELNRRRFLGALAAATVAGVGAARLIVDPQPQTFAEAPSASMATPGPAAPAGLLPPPPLSARVPLPGGGALTTIPGHGDLLALTLDDGVNSDVVRAYAQLAKDTGARMTFFVNGIYNSWTDNLAMLRPLVESGQIQLGNHTWSHPEDYIVKMADQYFTPQSIVIGHLNHLPVTHVYPRLVDIIRSRNLRTVTLNDVFLKTP
jgi:hypothetical protein